MTIDTDKLEGVLTNNGHGANVHLTAAICELVEAAESVVGFGFGARAELKHRLQMLDDEIKEVTTA
jgi:hypothetical protein